MSKARGIFFIVIGALLFMWGFTCFKLLIKERQYTQTLLKALVVMNDVLKDQIDKLELYEKPYDTLVALHVAPQPDTLCTMCCCTKNLSVCHVACIRYKGGHNAMCQSLCAMKARGIPTPLEPRESGGK